MNRALRDWPGRKGKLPRELHYVHPGRGESEMAQEWERSGGGLTTRMWVTLEANAAPRAQSTHKYEKKEPGLKTSKSEKKQNK